MIKEARGFGSTIDEAKENAIANLNASPDDDIQFEVIATPKKKTFGLFGGCKAEVRVYVELPDEKPKAVKKAVKKNDGRQAKKIDSADKTPVKAIKEKPVKKKEDLSENNGGFGEAVDADSLEPNSRAAKSVAYLRTILTALGCENVSIKVAEKENAALISLDGEGLGVIIGHRGETLDSVQYLTGLASNNGGGYYKVSINIGNYREKREQTLRSLAKRVSEQVLRTKHSRSLEPMNPYERRVIHTAVQDIEGVVSASFGEGAGRRVVIAPEGTEIRPPRNYDRRDRSRGHDRRHSNTVASAPTREPKRDSDIPLYGKIK